MSLNIKLKVSEDSWSDQSKTRDSVDLSILCEGFRYTLREWRKWTHEELYLDEDVILTRGEYSIDFVNCIKKYMITNINLSNIQNTILKTKLNLIL